MADKYLKVGSNGLPAEQEALATSAGAGDAGKIPATGADGRLDESLMSHEIVDASAGAGDADKIIKTDASGLLDPTFLPPSVGQNVDSIVASEALTAGDWVNIYDNTGVANVRKADSSNGRRAHGFVRAAVSSSATATVYGPGELNDQLSGLTIGAQYFLGTAGSETTTVPTTATHIVQGVGVAKSATAIRFDPTLPITRA